MRPRHQGLPSTGAPRQSRSGKRDTRRRDSRDEPGHDESGPAAIDLGEDREKVLAMFDVSRETIGRLDRFVDLLLNWQRRTNLIAPSTVPSLWTRHVADSLQLLDLVEAQQEKPPSWLDLGSGGGFPGIVIACAIANVPGAQIHLVESNQKKAAFLREAVRETNAPGVVHAARIASVSPALEAMAFDYVTARALAPLPDLLEMVVPFVKKGAKALLLKGQDLDHELTESTKHWHIEAETVVSKTNKAGRILIVHTLSKRIKLSPAEGGGQGRASEAARNRRGVD